MPANRRNALSILELPACAIRPRIPPAAPRAHHPRQKTENRLIFSIAGVNFARIRFYYRRFARRFGLLLYRFGLPWCWVLLSLFPCHSCSCGADVSFPRRRESIYFLSADYADFRR
jgi:hypothetical protein